MNSYCEKICPVRGFANEAFIERQQFVFEMEQLPTVAVGEDLAAGDGQNLALAFADFAPADIGNTEIVACDGAGHESFFFHLEGYGLRLAEFGEDPKWRLEGLQGHGE